MPTAVEITRVGAQVDPSSKGWGPSNNTEEWKIVVLLSDTPNKAWSRAWEETTQARRGSASELDSAEWEFKPADQRIEIWATADVVETLIRQLDEALSRANKRCGEMIEESDRVRAAQGERVTEERAEAASLQEKLDSLKPGG